MSILIRIGTIFVRKTRTDMFDYSFNTVVNIAKINYNILKRISPKELYTIQQNTQETIHNSRIIFVFKNMEFGKDPNILL